MLYSFCSGRATRFGMSEHGAIDIPIVFCGRGVAAIVPVGV